MGCLVFIGNVLQRWLFPITGQPVREKAHAPVYPGDREDNTKTFGAIGWKPRALTVWCSS
jgi:hypothetical protein